MKQLIAFLGLSLLIITFQGEVPVQAQTGVIFGVHEASDQSVATAKTPLRTYQITEKYYTNKLVSLGIDLRPGYEFRSDSLSTSKDAKRCKSVVYSTLLTLPEIHRNQLKSLTLYYTKDGRRGLGGGSSIILRCLNVSDEELSSVLVHEVGHLVDSSFLTGEDKIQKSSFYDFDTPVSVDDPSIIFYGISWKSDKKKKADAAEIDFVSGYAMTDPFEDFAETYTFYRLHGEEFRNLLESSAALQEKYKFMKQFVFDGEEFGQDTQKIAAVSLFDRPFDVTILPY